MFEINMRLIYAVTFAFCICRRLAVISYKMSAWSSFSASLLQCTDYEYICSESDKFTSVRIFVLFTIGRSPRRRAMFAD